MAGENNELTADHWASFEALLRESDDACRLYFEYVEESDFLQTIFDAMPDEDSSSDLFSLEQQEPLPSATHLPATLTARSAISPRAGRWRIWWQR